MRIDLIPVGKSPPDDLNVIIEVPTGGEPVKYEFDKASGALFVDRILHTPMRYPANYGFVPHTLSPDGDPLDALVVARSPFIPGCVVRARPIAVLNLEDEAGGDEKLVCVPVDSTFPYYSNVSEREDMPEIVFEQIEHFFTHYKDLEKKKWVRVGTWGGRDEARRITLEAIDRYNAAKAHGEDPQDAGEELGRRGSGGRAAASADARSVPRPRSVTARQPRQRVALDALHRPLVHAHRAQLAVKRDRVRVPVEHRPFEPRAPALDRDARQIAEQRLADAMPAGLGRDVEVLQIQPAPPGPGAETVKEQRKAERHPVALGNHRLRGRSRQSTTLVGSRDRARSEQRVVEQRLARLHRVGLALERGELAHEAKHRRHVGARRRADSHAHAPTSPGGIAGAAPRAAVTQPAMISAAPATVHPDTNSPNATRPRIAAHRNAVYSTGARTCASARA